LKRLTPKNGYLPGPTPYALSEKTKILGVEVMYTKSDRTVVAVRKLISSASPLTSNKLGVLAGETLLNELK
jgi:molecular chaperone Hsp31 and glyoxalase 3